MFTHLLGTRFKNKVRLLGFFIVLFFFLWCFLSSTAHYKIGTLFFGKISSLYNVSIAQFFFIRATNPIIGNTPSGAYYQLSRTYFIQGKLDESLIAANKELELYPRNCRTYYIRGLTYGYMEDIDNAIEDFRTFNTTCVQGSWAGHNDLAWLYFRKGDIKNMLLTIEEIAKDYDYNPWVQNTYGTALLNIGRYEESMVAFKKALTVARGMRKQDWGTAYPGNDPRIYESGLQSMQEVIEENLKLAEQKMSNK